MRSSIARAAAALSLVAISAAAPPAFAQKTPKPDAATLEEAKKHMKAGAAFYNDPSGHKCEEALREFSKAYELSGSLNALKGMAVCNLELERDGDAIEQYTTYLEGKAKEKGKKFDPAEKKQVENDLAALKAAVATVKLTVNRPDVQLTDVRTPSKGFPITNRYTIPQDGKSLGIHPGAHTFTASTEGYPDLVWNAEISNGGQYEHSFEFEAPKPQEPDKSEDAKPTVPEGPAEPPSRPVPATVWIFGGLTLALTAPTAIFMVRAGGLNDDYKARNGNAPAAELEQMRSDVQTANLIADIFLGATVASAVATTVFFITRPTKPAQPAAGSFAVAPTVGRTGGGAVLVGSF